MDVWLAPGTTDGYEFIPLRSAQDVIEEARAMKNCVRGYGSDIAHDASRLWSIRKDGARVATLETSWWGGHLLLEIHELQAAENNDAPIEVWQAAMRWMREQKPVFFFNKTIQWSSAPLDRETWLAFWKPYWLAKRAIPEWLPLTPSRDALRAL
jgi:hypothetical protein